MRESYNSLSKPSKQAVSRITRVEKQTPLKQRNPSSKALKAIQKVNKISLPDAVHDKYRECQQDPSKFWVWAGIQLDLESSSVKPIAVFLSEVYLGITGLETQRQWDTISWRFFVMFFYDLVENFGRKYLTSAFEDELVAMLSSSTTVTDTTKKIRGNLKHWVASGSRYAKLSDSLGDGAPFLLPQSVTDKT